MVIRSRTAIRTANPEDQQKLAHLVHFDAFVHRHLDYRSPLEWIGEEPFLILEDQGKVEATLACPPNPPKVAWIRLFAASYNIRPQKAWESMWPLALAQLVNDEHLIWAAAIPLQKWFQVLLERSRFTLTHSIVMLTWERQPLTNGHLPSWLTIRPMKLDDLSDVEGVDEAAFVPVWQNSKICLEYAFRAAAFASVAEVDNHIVGYQISTTTHMGGHLARLAVIPELQGQGIGSAILKDLLTQFERKGALIVSVNTQKENHASLALYKKAGFRVSNEEYPIYQLEMKNSNGNIG
jgi:ribosomal protein S18 acetylase RimI-like enzyme